MYACQEKWTRTSAFGLTPKLQHTTNLNRHAEAVHDLGLCNPHASGCPALADPAYETAFVSVNIMRPCTDRIAIILSDIIHLLSLSSSSSFFNSSYEY